MEANLNKQGQNTALKKTGLLVRAVAAFKVLVGRQMPQSPEQPFCPAFWDVLIQFNKNDCDVRNLSGPTREKRQFMLNNILAFLTEAGLRDIRIDQVRIRHMEQLRQWLHTTITQPNGKPISVDHSTRHLRLSRSALNYAVDQEYVINNPISGIRCPRSSVKEIVSCSPIDVAKFERYHNERIPQRNLICLYFLYQCFTGISYMDIWRHKIVQEQYRTKNGEIKTRLMVSCLTGRGKNGKMYWAPFTRKAQELYELIAQQYGEFPFVSLQTYNRSIKKIAKECGVDLYLTTHIGRKTFATLMRIDGFSMPAIAVALGNTEQTCRTSYAAGGKEMLLNELDRLENVQVTEARKNQGELPELVRQPQPFALRKGA